MNLSPSSGGKDLNALFIGAVKWWNYIASVIGEWMSIQDWKDKRKGKFNPRAGFEGPEGE
jgi:hypothetical protein